MLKCDMPDYEEKATWEVALDQLGINKDHTLIKGALKIYYCDEHMPHRKIVK